MINANDTGVSNLLVKEYALTQMYHSGKIKLQVTVIIVIQNVK